MRKNQQRNKRSGKLKDVPISARKARGVKGGYTKTSSTDGTSLSGQTTLSTASGGYTTTLQKYGVTPIPIP